MTITYVLAHAEEASHWSLPPLHPILVNFTAALIPASLLFDILGTWFRRESLRSAGWWTMCFAAIVTPLTALAGWLWLRSMPEMDHSPMAIHKWLGAALAIATVPVAGWRGWLHWRAKPPQVAYMLAATVLLAALVYQADLGGTMSFGESQPSSTDHPHPTPTSSSAERPDHEHDHHEHSP